MTIHDILNHRFSARSFRSKPVSEDVLTRLLTVAGKAPSSYNQQPWRYVVLTDLSPLKDVLADGNEWVLKAPAVLAVFCEQGESHFNIGLSVENVILAATEEGLSAHVVGGFNRPALAKCVASPDTMEPVCLIAIGYPDKSEQSIKAKKPLREIAMAERFGSPWPGSVREMPEKTLDIPISIRFRDLDALGHVNNATIITYLEEARIRFRDILLPGYAGENVSFVVAENQWAYIRPVLFRDRIVVRCYLSHMNEKSCRFNYILLEETTGEVKGKGSTVIVGLDNKTGNVIPLNPEFVHVAKPYTV